MGRERTRGRNPVSCSQEFYSAAPAHHRSGGMLHLAVAADPAIHVEGGCSSRPPWFCMLASLQSAAHMVLHANQTPVLHA